MSFSFLNVFIFQAKSHLFLSQIEALRAKLETKNTQIEQKERVCERLEAELTVEKGRVSDLRDTNRVSFFSFVIRENCIMFSLS